MKSTGTKTRILYAAVAGLLTVASAGCGQKPAEQPQPAAPEASTQPAATDAMDKHACKGMNACSGKGGCAVKDQNGCKGQNPCKGKGGCKSA